MHTGNMLFAPMIDDRPESAKRLREAREARGFSDAKAAARFFNWPYETYAQHENGTRGIPRAAKKYAIAYRVSEAWLLTGEGSGPDNRNSPGGLIKSKTPVGVVRTIGKVAANTWLSVDDMDFGYDDVDTVPSVGGYPVEWQYALLVEGNCLNKKASHGDRLICLDTIKAGVDISEDDLAIVERKRYGGQMVERTAKRVRRAADGFELWPESTDPLHQEPIRLYRVPEGEEVEIVGKVLWILRKP